MTSMLKKTLIIGDVHANTDFVESVLKLARSANIHTIVALGDFGYRFSEDFLDLWRGWLDEDEENVLYWLDGNHDNHDLIAQFMSGKSYDSPVSQWHDRMFYCPRGSVTYIGESRCLFLGGAHSIDRALREPGVSWWYGERVSEEDVLRACSRSNIDVMFTHECPNTEWFSEQLKTGQYKIDYVSADQRNKISQVVSTIRPRVLYHGHYHFAYSSEYGHRSGYTQVEGLSADFSCPPSHACNGDNVRIVYL